MVKPIGVLLLWRNLSRDRLRTGHRIAKSVLRNDFLLLRLLLLLRRRWRRRFPLRNGLNRTMTQTSYERCFVVLVRSVMIVPGMIVPMMVMVVMMMMTVGQQTTQSSTEQPVRSLRQGRVRFWLLFDDVGVRHWKWNFGFLCDRDFKTRIFHHDVYRRWRRNFFYGLHSFVLNVHVSWCWRIDDGGSRRRDFNLNRRNNFWFFYNGRWRHGFCHSFSCCLFCNWFRFNFFLCRFWFFWLVCLLI